MRKIYVQDISNTSGQKGWNKQLMPWGQGQGFVTHENFWILTSCGRKLSNVMTDLLGAICARVDQGAFFKAKVLNVLTGAVLVS